MAGAAETSIYEVYVNGERKGDFGGLVDLTVTVDKSGEAFTITSGKHVYYYRNAQPGTFKVALQLGKVLLQRVAGGDPYFQESAFLYSGGRVQQTLTKITVDSTTDDYVLTKDGLRV